MWKRIFVNVVTVVVVLQCYRPPKNLSAAPAGDGDFLVRQEAPAEMQGWMRAACYDCHSNRTRYPWYAEIQPFGWWLADHVADGKAELNLSEFGEYPPRRQRVKIDTMIETLEERSMPLKSYTWMHREAKLSDAQLEQLIGWLEAQRDALEAEEEAE